MFATCLGLAALGAGLAFSAGFRDDSPLAIAGAILVLFAVFTGLATLLTAFVLEVPVIFRMLTRQMAESGPVRADPSPLQSSDQQLPGISALFIFGVTVILFFHVAVVVFLFSPLSKNPIALLVVALAGFAVAGSFLISARVRAWLRQVLRAAGG